MKTVLAWALMPVFVVLVFVLGLVLAVTESDLDQMEVEE